jgi:hypothetical protein
MENHRREGTVRLVHDSTVFDWINICNCVNCYQAVESLHFVAKRAKLELQVEHLK